MKRLIVQTKIRPFSNLYYLTPLYCLLNGSSCQNKRLLFTFGDSVLFFFNLYLEQRDNSFQEEKVLWASAIAQDTSDSGYTQVQYFHFSHFVLKSHELSVSAKFMILCAFWDSWHSGYLPWFRFQHVMIWLLLIDVRTWSSRQAPTVSAQTLLHQYLVTIHIFLKQFPFLRDRHIQYVCFNYFLINALTDLGQI